MEEISQNTPVQRIRVAILSLDLPCSGFVTRSGDISITDKSHKKRDFWMCETATGQQVTQHIDSYITVMIYVQLHRLYP
jgi:hypothetical protein